MESSKNILNANYSVVEYVKLFKGIFGKDYNGVPLWEIKSKTGIIYILTEIPDKGFEIYWFDESNNLDPNEVIYKTITDIEYSEDALYWTIGRIEYYGFRSYKKEERHRIMRLVKLGSYNPETLVELEENKTLFEG